MPDKARLDAAARGLTVVVLVAFLLVVFRMFDGLTTPFLVFSVSGGIVIQVAYRAKPLALLSSAVVGGVLAGGYVLLHAKFGDYTLAGPIACLAFLGLGATIVLGYTAISSTESLGPFLLSVFCSLLAVVTNIALVILISYQPLVYDRYLYKFDWSYGFQASEAAAQLFQISTLLQDVCFVVYNSLPLAITIVLLLYVKKRAMAANPFYTMVVAGVLGCCCYQLLPAAGPVHVFHGFPNGLPAQVSLTAEPLPWIPRNAIPSLHTAWALLVYWAVAKYSRPVRWAAAVFVLLTLLATLGFGEHYLIDLVVAVPFAVAVQAFCARHWVQSGVCLAGTLAWLIYLRFGLPHAAPSVATTWILTAISVAPGLFWVPGRVEESSRRAERKVQQVPSLADVPGTR